MNEGRRGEPQALSERLITRVEGPRVCPVRGLALRRRRSRVPWIFLVYHARRGGRPAQGSSPSRAGTRKQGVSIASPTRVAQGFSPAVQTDGPDGVALRPGQAWKSL